MITFLTLFSNQTKLDYYKLGTKAWDNKQFFYALKLLEKAIEVNPMDIRDYKKLISISFLDKEYEDAVKYCNQAIHYFPLDLNLYLYRADAYKMLGEFEKSLNNFKLIIEITPNYEAAFTGAATASYFLENYDDALYYANKAIELNPTKIYRII